MIERDHPPMASTPVTDVIDMILRYMKSGVDQMPDNERGWDGQSYTVDTEQDHYEGSIAIWSLVLHRWIHIIE